MNLLYPYRYLRWVRREAASVGRDQDVLDVLARTIGGTQQVVLRDRIAAPWWTAGLAGAPIRTVRIPITCPACGGRRGDPVWSGRDITHAWINPCGHRDTAHAVITAADEAVLAARVEATVHQILTTTPKDTAHA